jgi:hypothetical protein
LLTYNVCDLLSISEVQIATKYGHYPTNLSHNPNPQEPVNIKKIVTQ